MVQSQCSSIVEDQFDNREMIATYLEHAGYRALTAADGVDRLERARARCPDMVLMDSSMPGSH
jgi:two-component system OmpR family response regulator